MRNKPSKAEIRSAYLKARSQGGYTDKDIEKATGVPASSLGNFASEGQLGNKPNQKTKHGLGYLQTLADWLEEIGYLPTEDPLRIASRDCRVMADLLECDQIQERTKFNRFSALLRTLREDYKRILEGEHPLKAS